MVTDTKAKVTYMEFLKEDLFIIRIVPEGGVPDYKAGQFLTIGVPIPTENYKIVRRAYSIASHPENKNYFEFVIRWVRKPLPGRVTTMLMYASEGDQVLMGMPTGNALTINDKMPDGSPDTRRIVCVGGGTGLAPFVSFAKHLHDTGDKREIIVLHGASYVDELSYKMFLTDLENESIDRGRDKWNFKYRAAISRPKEWFGEKITKDNTFVYVCGYQGTIDGVLDVVQPNGFVTMQNKHEDGSFDIKLESYG
jgi:ferredoxin--NADP+ reductase